MKVANFTGAFSTRFNMNSAQQVKFSEPHLAMGKLPVFVGGLFEGIVVSLFVATQGHSKGWRSRFNESILSLIDSIVERELDAVALGSVPRSDKLVYKVKYIDSYMT